MVAPIPTDHWLDFWQIIGSLAAALGLSGGVVLGVAYSRRATVAVVGEVHPAPHDTVLLVVVPSVTAVGPFRLNFKDEDPAGAVVEVQEVLITDDGRKTTKGHVYPPRQAFPRDEKGKQQFVGQGETLTNTLFFVVRTDAPNLSGWLICLSVSSKGIRRGMHWQDRSFVPFDPSSSFVRAEAGGNNDDSTGPGEQAPGSGVGGRAGSKEPDRPRAGLP
jgi:hypothetical protein